ncbi:MAG: ABC transporter ATP-binding protein [Acidimicrobiales bacterium]
MPDIPGALAQGAGPGGPVSDGRRPAVRTCGLTKRYGDRVAVAGVDFELPAGVVSGFVGPNGAGKTTTIQMLLGLARPSAGTAEVLGCPITNPAAYLSQVGALIETPSFYPTLSGFRNLEVLARLGRYHRERIDAVLGQVGLGERGDDPVGSYSLGMKQRLGVAAALLPSPGLLVLDEPTNGLDPAGIREMRLILRSLADEGITVFVSSHLLGEIEAICDHLVVIDMGRIVFQGSVQALLAQQTTAVLARPEHRTDLQRLAGLCFELGYTAEVEGDVLRVPAPATWAAQLNREAMAIGITLVELATTQGSLEEAFFSMTDDAVVIT